jgi:hypothetical protein
MVSRFTLSAETRHAKSLKSIIGQGDWARRFRAQRPSAAELISKHPSGWPGTYVFNDLNTLHANGFDGLRNRHH